MGNPARDQGSVPDIPALSRIQDLEMALILTSQALVDLQQTITTQQQAITTQQQKITEQHLKINSQADNLEFYNQLFAVWIAPLDISAVDAVHAADTPVVDAPAANVPAVIAPAADIPVDAAQAAATPIIDAHVVVTSVTATPIVDAHVAAACIKTKPVSPRLTETQKRERTALTNKLPELSMAPKRQSRHAG
ncbi:hypothetical protein GGI17_004202 [Coemansia sp. S146]|nr:hypothetical protein GGI17_004202 [Coemansia sp. S146]